MIDLQHKFLFIHIGNSAGTSVEKSLSTEDTYFTPFGRRPRGAHWTYWVKERWFKDPGNPYTKDLDFTFEDLYKFVIVRNPWDRMVSKYMHESQNVEKFNQHISDGSKGGPDFISFLMYIKENNLQKLHHSPSLDWFPPEKMDKIIIFDNLQKGFQEAMKEIGLEKALEDIHPGLTIGTWKKPNRNLDSFGNPRKHYSLYYNDECVEFVRERFKKDIDYFNFEFDDKR